MAMQLVPYNLTISIGAGFNSYTQQLCINDAVEQDPERGNSDTELQSVSRSTGPGQNVVWVSKFVDSVAEVTSAMNVSGATAIKENGNLDSSSGAFVSLENMKGSDLNYLVQVKVTSQLLEANNLTRIRKIPGIKPSEFTEVYGDSFVSGFIEGGEFTALLSISVDEEIDIAPVKRALQTAIENLESGKYAANYEDIQNLIAEGKATVLISVAWIGDTTQDPADAEWTIEAVREAAIDFPQKVALYPQRTHAALTKYTALPSYRDLINSQEPVNYEYVKRYTDKLLDDYFEYKYIWKQIETTSKYVSNTALQPQVETPGLISYGIESNARIERSPTGYEKLKGAGEDSKPQPTPYPATLIGLQQARRNCRMEMNKIVKEVDVIASNPGVVRDGTRQRPYLDPRSFKQLIPGQN